MDENLKTRLLGIVMAVMDGRDARYYVTKLNADQCVEGHALMNQVDELLKAQWVLLGPHQPESEAA